MEEDSDSRMMIYNFLRNDISDLNDDEALNIFRYIYINPCLGIDAYNMLPLRVNDNLIQIASTLNIQHPLQTEILTSINNACMEYCTMLPTIEQVGMEYLKLLRCECLIITSDNIVKSLIHIWKHLNTVPCTCYFIDIISQYYAIEHHMPNESQLNSFIEHLQRILDDPEDYCNEERTKLPVIGIENLSPIRNTENNIKCGICMEEIQNDSMVFKLPQCGHLFHSNQSECLGESNILKWFETSKHCPICKTEVCIECV